MKSRKMLALLLAMVMVLGLCSMASAAAPTDRVQINNMMVDILLLTAWTSDTQFLTFDWNWLAGILPASL